MDEILKTKIVESKNSAILIDLVKHTSGKKYLKLTQTKSENHKSSILLNPEIVNDVVYWVKHFSSEIDQETSDSHLARDQKIVEAYLKGVSSEDLAMRFESTKEEIEMILRNKGIEIFERRPPFFRRRK